MADATPATKRPMFSFMNFFWLLLAGLLAVLLAFNYLNYSIQSTVEPVNDVRVLTGYLKRGENKLEKDFTDANGDLVADCPTDAAKQIDPETLVFAPIAGAEGDSAEDWQALLDHIKRVTGKNVEFQQSVSPPDQAADLKAGKLHICGFNTGYVPTAVNIGGYVPLACMADATGKWGYQMELIVPADSPIAAPEKIRGHVIYLTSAGSHSGFKCALITLRDKFNLTPGKDYEFKLSGGHVSSIRGVAAKSMDVVAVANDILDREIERGSIKKGEYKTIFQSDRFPPGCYGYAHQLKPELAAKVKEAFVTFDWTGTALAKKYEGSKVAKFAPISYKDDWKFVREIDEKMVQW